MLKVLEKLMDEHTGGDPDGKRKICRVDTYFVSDALKAKGYEVCPNTAGKLLRELDYSLRANRKEIAETHHPDRDRQFNIIKRTREDFEAAGEPIISIDTKKRQLVGNFKNAGRARRKEADKVSVHDFPSHAKGVAIPHGILEPVRNLGTVVVGVSHDTAQFAVDSIKLWLTNYASQRYPAMKRLLILCDSGGSNNCRSRLWKYVLYHQVCRPYGISVRVCHYPDGASKWNPVEHHLFSYIQKEWEGEPLRSYNIILGFIRSTTTRTGLRVAAHLNRKKYQTGLNITDSQMQEVQLVHHKRLPLWNYTIGA